MKVLEYVNKIVLDILSTFISWTNLDLDIETCFYNGMARDGYSFIYI